MPERPLASFRALAGRQASASPIGARAPPLHHAPRQSQKFSTTKNGEVPRRETRRSINGIASTNDRERTSNFREVPGGGSGYAQFGVQGVRSIATWKGSSCIRKPLCALRMRNGPAGADARGVLSARSRNAPAELSETGRKSSTAALGARRGRAVVALARGRSYCP